MHTIYYSRSIPFFTKENLTKLNQYLSEVEIDIGEKTIAVNSAKEYFDKFKISLTSDDNGNIIRVHCLSDNKEIKNILLPVVNYITPNVHFYDFDKEPVRYTIRKYKIVRVY